MAENSHFPNMDDDEQHALFMSHLATQQDAHLAEEPRAHEDPQIAGPHGDDGLLDLLAAETKSADDPPAVVDGRANLLTQALVSIITGSSSIQFRAQCVDLLGASCEGNLRTKLQEHLYPLFAVAPAWATSKAMAALPTSTVANDSPL